MVAANALSRSKVESSPETFTIHTPRPIKKELLLDSKAPAMKVVLAQELTPQSGLFMVVISLTGTEA
jgi:hypothetical protein